MNTLVVGGAGYIGGGLLQQYFGPRTVYDALLYQDDYMGPDVFIRGDIRDYERLRSALKDKTHVIWLAAMVGDPQCDKYPKEAQEINYDAVKWLVDNFKGRIVFASSCSVYGDSGGETVAPLTLYAKLKLEAEKLLKGHTIIRFGTAHGWSPHRFRYDLVVNRMVADAVLDGKINLYGGDQVRPFIHIRDAGKVLADALRMTPGTYNAATQNLTISQVANMISSLAGCKVERHTANEDRRTYRVAELQIEDFTSVYQGATETENYIKSGYIRNPKIHANHIYEPNGRKE